MNGGQAEEPVFAQVERTHESVAESKCLLFAHGIVFNLYRGLSVAHHLHYPTLVSRKLHEEGRMVLHSPKRSLLQRFDIGFYWEGQTYRGVIQR